MTQIDLRKTDPRDPRAIALVEASQAMMRALYDADDNHALPVEALAAPHIAFFGAFDGPHMLGCGALANQGHFGELKAMFVDPAARGRGIARLLLDRIEREAQAQGLTVLNLETGDGLEAALALYTAAGFERCGPFGDYANSPASVFMTKILPPASPDAQTGSHSNSQ